MTKRFGKGSVVTSESINITISFVSNDEMRKQNIDYFLLPTM